MRQHLLTYLRLHPGVLGVPSVIVVLAAWEVFPRFMNSLFFPPASSVLEVFTLQWASGEYLPHVLVTLGRMVSGYAAAVVVAVPLGLAMGYWRRVFDMLELTVEVIRPIPSSALIPVALIFFGIGHNMHIFVVFITSFMPILWSTIGGVRAVDPVLISTAITLGTPPYKIFYKAILPAALPHVLTGLRISIALALIVAVASEMIISSEGLGWKLLYAQQTLKIAEIYASILTLGIIGYLLNRLFLVVESRVVGWHLRAATKRWE